MRAQRVGEKVARVASIADASRLARQVTEENRLGELDAAIASGDKAQIEAELGDALFALVNMARHFGIDAEGALRGTTDKFTRRFSHVEKRVRDTHGGWPKDAKDERLSLAELDGYWDEAKALEAALARPNGAKDGASGV